LYERKQKQLEEPSLVHAKCPKKPQKSPFCLRKISENLDKIYLFKSSFFLLFIILYIGYFVAERTDPRGFHVHFWVDFKVSKDPGGF
jgi:hypothetical protein